VPTKSSIKMIRTITPSDPAGDDDSGALAESAVHTWRKVSSHLIPIIGEGGVRALYARSLHLTRTRFPWLRAAQQQLPSDSHFAELGVSLAHQSPADAREATAALLATFINLLSTLIGEDLTAHLLRSLSPEDSPPPPSPLRRAGQGV
jgi:hypothetical protein